MNRSTLARIHAAAALTAFGLITVFFISTFVAEVSGRASWIIAVKKGIFYGMWAMPLLMPAAGWTGFRLAGKSQHPIILRKRSRLRWIVANGLLLLGLAVFLYGKAAHNQLDTVFLGAQLLESGLGATNLFLLGAMIRDGLRLRPKAGKKEPGPRKGRAIHPV
ncbi:hypothetical protein [Larkinella soli]|uniref:hypothetical protein n=1 Tax=Larkinella soli TaxID=1770527 RepID=UPI0019D01869|nr:hypothetical protein [Larkinella soli]